MFLFVRRSGGAYGGQWWPVTGTLESGESPLVGALRELEEETALVPDAVYSTGLTPRLGESADTLEYFVVLVSPEASVRLNWEHDAFRWFSLAEAVAEIDEVAHPYLRVADRIARTLPAAQRVFPA